jgi:hypothetical protein
VGQLLPWWCKSGDWYFVAPSTATLVHARDAAGRCGQYASKLTGPTTQMLHVGGDFAVAIGTPRIVRTVVIGDSVGVIGIVIASL